MLLRAEPGKQRPRSCRTRELARSSGPRKGAAEKCYLTGLDKSRHMEETHANKRGEKSVANILLAKACKRTAQVRVTHLLRVARRNQRRIGRAKQDMPNPMMGGRLSR